MARLLFSGEPCKRCISPERGWSLSSPPPPYPLPPVQGRKDLSVSLHQAIVLLLFNDETILTCAQIQELTDLGRFGSRLCRWAVGSCLVF